MVLFLLCAQVRADDCGNHFGAGVSLSPLQKVGGNKDITDLKGDYNGDGIIDHVMFLLLVDKPVFSESVRVIRLSDDDPVYPKNGSMAIGIILNGKEKKSCKKYIIYDDFFFSREGSSMWGGEADSYGVGFVKKGTAGYRYWKRQVSGLKFDALQIESESTVSFLLYWNGETFVTHWDKYVDP
jgi:hypothetical protein